MIHPIVRAIDRLNDRDLLRLAHYTSAEIRDRVKIRRIFRSLKENDVSRLGDKLQQARAVAPRQAAKIEARADAIIQSEPDIEKQTDEAFAPHESLLDEAQKELEGLKNELAIMTNNPPLEKLKHCPRCAVGEKPHLDATTMKWVHDVTLPGESKNSTVECSNPPKDK